MLTKISERHIGTRIACLGVVRVDRDPDNPGEEGIMVEAVSQRLLSVVSAALTPSASCPRRRRGSGVVRPRPHVGHTDSQVSPLQGARWQVLAG